MKLSFLTTLLSISVGIIMFAQDMNAENARFLEKEASGEWIGKIGEATVRLQIGNVEDEEDESGWHIVHVSVIQNEDVQDLIGTIGNEYLEDQFELFLEMDFGGLSLKGSRNDRLWGYWGSEEDGKINAQFDYFETCPKIIGNNQLTTITAKGGNARIVNWGSAPIEKEDEPTEPWTWTHLMCDAPYAQRVFASSTLSSQGSSNYSIENVMDDNPTTAWVEGSSGYGIGEYFEFENWRPMGDGDISILNGYQRSQSAWESNSRVKRFLISLNGKEVCFVDLEDKMGVQSFLLPQCFFNEIDLLNSLDEKWVLRFTIQDVYKGTKYSDTCISGIFSCGG